MYFTSMNTINYSKFLFAALVIMSCNPVARVDESSAPAKKEFDELFTKVLDAHGGFANWQKVKYLEYTINTGSGPEVHRNDLTRRRHRIDKEGGYSMGYDGQDIWVSPHRDSFPGSSPRFYHNLHFYFFAIPFILSDDGVHLEEIEDMTVREKTYHRILATFGEGVGDAPDDQYILYIDPEAYQVDFINYSVTFYDKSKATQYNALDYTYDEVNGLLLPSGYTGYRWVDGTFGDKRYHADFTDIKLSEEPVDTTIFTAPLGAWIEEQSQVKDD